MKIGFSAPTAGPLSALDPLVRLCVGAEELGFDYGTFSDHVINPTEIASPYPYSATGEFTNQGTGERNEQLIELAFVAARTTKRSEERRVGKEGRSRWWPDHQRK